MLSPPGFSRITFSRFWGRRFRYPLWSSLGAGRTFLRHSRPSHEEGAFFSPNYELQPLVPWLLSLRNAAKSPLRLLFIAHAPGKMPWIWKLLPPLLRRGDRIVAPSAHAARVIEWLIPEIAPAVRMIPHPIPLPAGSSKKPGRTSGEHFLVLGRLRPEKCLHQLLEGYALFSREPRRDLPSLVIAGPHVEEEEGNPSRLPSGPSAAGAEAGAWRSGSSSPEPLREPPRRSFLKDAGGFALSPFPWRNPLGRPPQRPWPGEFRCSPPDGAVFPSCWAPGESWFLPLWKEAEEMPSLDPRKIAKALGALCDLPRQKFSGKEGFSLEPPYSPNRVTGRCFWRLWKRNFPPRRKSSEAGGCWPGRLP